MNNFFKAACLVLAVLFYTSVESRSYSDCLPLPVTDTTGLLAAGATLQLVSDSFGFTEGPAVDKRGAVFFTDQNNNQIWKYGVDKKLTLFLDKSGRSNGLHFDNAGHIIACADENNQVWRISPEGKKTVLYKAPKRRRLNGPNDVWVTASNGIYITDPYYQRPYWKRKKPALNGQNVYYLPPGKKRLLAVETNVKQPNGIVGSPDGKWLYVADIGDSKIYKYEIQPNGLLKNKILFIAQGSDGMTLDNQGNLYLTGNGITVYNAAGSKIAQIAVPAKWTSNVCFSGSEKKTLFITASEAVYVLEMQVKGVE